MTAGRGIVGRIGGWLLIVGWLWCRHVDAGEVGAPTPVRPPASWSLVGRGDGISKLVAVERGGHKLQVLYANGGNVLEIRSPAKTPKDGQPEKSQGGERIRLECALLLAEYDDRTKQIERLLCAGRVQVTIESEKSAPDKPAPSTYFDAAALAFQRQKVTESENGEREPAAQRSGPLGLLNGVWTLSSVQPMWPELPAEFGQWLAELPPADGGRVLLRSDRLTLLAPQATFDPVAGRCEAGPDRVTGSFEAEPKPAHQPGKAVAERSVAWSSQRRTVFGCRQLRGQFAIDAGGLRPAGPTALEGDVLIYQPATDAHKGIARLIGDTVTMVWPLTREIKPPTPEPAPTGATSAWQGYELLAVQSGKDRELELRDGDMTIRGGELMYKPAFDEGQLKPIAGARYVVSEMNLPPDAKHPERGSAGRVRLRAEELRFQLKTRKFEASGERILENLPVEPVENR